MYLYVVLFCVWLYLCINLLYSTDLFYLFTVMFLLSYVLRVILCVFRFLFLMDLFYLFAVASCVFVSFEFSVAYVLHFCLWFCFLLSYAFFFCIFVWFYFACVLLALFYLCLEFVFGFCFRLRVMSHHLFIFFLCSKVSMKMMKIRMKRINNFKMTT